MYTPINEIIRKHALNWLKEKQSQVDNSNVKKAVIETAYAFENFSIAHMRKIRNSRSLLRELVRNKCPSLDIPTLVSVATYIQTVFTVVHTTKAVREANAESTRRNTTIRWSRNLGISVG